MCFPARKFCARIKCYELFLCGVKKSMNKLQLLLLMHMNEKVFISCEETWRDSILVCFHVFIQTMTCYIVLDHRLIPITIFIPPYKKIWELPKYKCLAVVLSHLAEFILKKSAPLFVCVMDINVSGCELISDLVLFRPHSGFSHSLCTYYILPGSVRNYLFNSAVIW